MLGVQVKQSPEPSQEPGFVALECIWQINTIHSTRTGGCPSFAPFLLCLFTRAAFVLKLEKNLLYDEDAIHNCIRVTCVITFRPDRLHLERQATAAHRIIVASMHVENLPCLP
jgi:hypothetical protein